MILHLDTETFGTTPIKAGAHRYAEDAEVILVSVAVDDDPTQVWDTSNPEPRKSQMAALQGMIDAADKVVIHNSAFDRTVLRIAHGVIIPVEKIEDTMVLALQHSLPGSLGTLCDVLGVPQDQAKDKDGKKLINLFCKPRPKNMKLRRATRETHPDEWARFIEYARLDVDAMRSVRGRVPRWNDNPSERYLWQLDQRINDRGACVDDALARSALRAFERASGALAARTSDLTGGAVTATTQRAKLMDHLRGEHDLVTADMTKATVDFLLRTEEMDDTARELLEIRQQAAATSPAKYKALLGAMSADGRLRGTVQFCGAARTGRDCLAEGTLILVADRAGEISEKPIERVLLSDRVWDGDDWVEHEGVVFSGDKEVIEHDGVVATAKHVVYVSGTESMLLGEAKAKGLPLWRGNVISSTG